MSERTDRAVRHLALADQRRRCSSRAASRSEPCVGSRTDAAYWMEGRPSEGGRSVVVRADLRSGRADVTPEGFNARDQGARVRRRVRSCVHRGGRLLPNFADQRLYRAQDPGQHADARSRRRRGGRVRYADGRVTADGSLADLRPRTARGRRRRERDRVPSRRTAPARRRSSWAAATSSRRRASRRTARSWRGSRGICRTCRGTAPSCGSRTSTERSRVRRTPRRRQARPEQSRSSSRSGVRTVSCTSSRTGPALVEPAIERSTARCVPICPMDAEFGWPQWVFGVSTYAFLDDGRIACIWTGTVRSTSP